jgi:hypothetical protein
MECVPEPNPVAQASRPRQAYQINSCKLSNSDQTAALSSRHIYKEIGRSSEAAMEETRGKNTGKQPTVCNCDQIIRKKADNLVRNPFSK